MSGYTPIQPDSIEPDSPVPVPVSHNETRNIQAPPPSYGAAKAANNGGFYTVSFYSQFFDINTEEFFGKIILALNPFNNASVVASEATATEEGPTELYGLIWINATLVFLMFVSATGSNLIAQWLHASDTSEKYEYNFQLLTLSISIFYGYTILVPALLFVVTTWVLHFTTRLSLTRLISIYSYANVLWIPTTAANVILAVFVSNARHHVILNVAQWTLVGVSAVLSGLSIILKVRPIILENTMPQSFEAEAPNQQNKHQVLLLALVVAHLAFAVVIKILFFGIA